VPSWENRALRQALWHRHRMVRARTRIMNQLQAVAINEGLRCKKRLWRERGRLQLESFRLAPWASRRRRNLLEPMDRLNPMITELSQAIEQEVEKCPRARRLMTHPGVGALTILAFVLIIGKAERFGLGKQVASYLGLVPLEESTRNRRRLGHITKPGSSMLRFLLVEAAQLTVRSLPEWFSESPPTPFAFIDLPPTLRLAWREFVIGQTIWHHRIIGRLGSCRCFHVLRTADPLDVQDCAYRRQSIPHFVFGLSLP
jgi:transposase